ncbi:MAG: helix-turn-helix domain-containing protein [Pseudomonadota bacterium]
MGDDARAQLDALPETLREVADVTSLGTALTLAAEKGGQRITIPSTVKPDHWLAKLVGLDAARAISDHFTLHGSHGSQQIRVPVMARSLQAQRRAEFAALDAQGATNNEIARHMRIAHRTVQWRRKAMKAQDRQRAPLPLFEADETQKD